jgi:hypothetical protein
MQLLQILKEPTISQSYTGRETRLQTEKEMRISGVRFCPFFAPGHVRARSHSHQSAIEQMALLPSDISSSSLSL